MASSRTRPDPLSGVGGFLAARVPAGGRLTVALSGGLDSVVLLHLLAGQRDEGATWQLDALHVDHGVNPHAGQWRAFCAELCQRFEVPFCDICVKGERLPGLGLEASLRKLRYGAFAGHPTDFLALAHHRDDQAETVLLRLLRGAGVGGLAGMPDHRPLGEGSSIQILRPLLRTSRAELYAYGRRHGLDWIEDDSNADISLRRNFLRHRVLPEIATRWPGHASSLARAAGHLREAAEVLDELADDDLRTRVVEGWLALDTMAELSPGRQRNALRRFLTAGGVVPEEAAFTELEQQLAGLKADTAFTFATGGRRLIAHRRRLAAVADLPPPAAEDAVVWRGESVVELPWGGRVVFRRVRGEGIATEGLKAGGAVLRPRLYAAGLRRTPVLKLGEHRPHREVRLLFQEHAVAPWWRERSPFLYLGGHLAWVGGLGVDYPFLCPEGEEGLLPVWEP